MAVSSDVPFLVEPTEYNGSNIAVLTGAVASAYSTTTAVSWATGS